MSGSGGLRNRLGRQSIKDKVIGCVGVLYNLGLHIAHAGCAKGEFVHFLLEETILLIRNLKKTKQNHNQPENASVADLK